MTKEPRQPKNPMSDDTFVELRDDEVYIDAAAIAGGLGIAPSAVCALMRSGEITSLCERGAGEDEGRSRLTFFYRGKRLRMRLDQEGRIVGCSTIDFGERPLPVNLRRPQP